MKRHLMNCPAERWLLALVIVVITWDFTCCIQPKILNFSYRTKQLSLIGQTITSNILTLELDQEVFHQVQCPFEFSEATRAQFMPCCPSINNATDCFLPDNTTTCIDGDGSRIHITGADTDVDSLRRSALKVSNYASCHSVSILNKAILGHVLLAVSIRYEFIPVSLSMNDFIRAEYGSNGLSLCCSTIRELNPNWTGEIHIGWQPNVNTQYEFTVSTDPLLPVSDFYMIPPVEIQCDGLLFTSRDCHERSGCWPTPAADDPIFALLKAFGGIEPYNTQPTRFSIGIVTRIDQVVNAQISNVAFPFPESRFADKTCHFIFPTLANNRSELLGNSVDLPFENEIPCDPVAFNETLMNFRARVGDLSNSSPRIYQETNEYFIRALLWVTADSWTSCANLVDRSLLQLYWSEATFENSATCLESNSSDTYLNDPCCNPNLQRIECCSPRNVSGVISSLNVASESVANMCKTPRCVTRLLNDYTLLLSTNSNRQVGCTIRTAQAIDTSVNALNDIEACIRAITLTHCTSNMNCSGVDAASVCLPMGVCSVPCQTNEECATQVCEKVPGTSDIHSCKFIDFADIENLSSEILLSTVWRCVEFNIDPFTLLFVKQELGQSAVSSRDDIVQLLVVSGSSPTCLGVNDVPTEQCNNVDSCNWAPCNSLFDPYCNIENCTDPNLGSDYFCGWCHSGLCAEVSTFPHCQYKGLLSLAECTTIGGSYNGLQYRSIVNQKCIRPTTDGSECFPPQFCSSQSNCEAKCYAPSRTLNNCSSTATNNIALQWQTWNVGGQIYGLCATIWSYVDTTSCLQADGELSWWPGTHWISGQLNTESQCELLGLCNGSPMLKSTCDTTYACTISQLKTQPECESGGDCNDFTGCVFDWDPIDFRCTQSLDWTPLGCYSYIISDEGACSSQGGRWLTRAQNLIECETKATICHESTTGTTLIAQPNSRSVMPTNISLKNKTECIACGGVLQPYFSWTGGQWLPAVFEPFRWRQRKFVRSNKLVSMPNEYLSTVVSAAIATRYAKALESHLECQFGQFSTSISSIVCDCTASGLDCFSGVSSSVVSVGFVCSFIPSNATSELASIVAGGNLLIEGDDCMNVRTKIVPISQFTIEQTTSLSAAALFSVKSQQQRSILFIRNSATVVVGGVISDGIQVNRDPHDFTGTLQACLTFPEPSSTENLQKGKEYRWALPNEDYSQLILQDFTVYPGEISCFPFENITQTYFAVELQQDWQNALFIQTLLPEEQGVIFLGVGLYAAALVFVLVCGSQSLKALTANQKNVTELNMGGFLLLTVALLLRLIFLFVLPFGGFESVQYSDVIFSELPAIVFLTCFATLVYQWVTLYHFGIKSGAGNGHKKLKFIFIAFISLLFLAFILIIIIFSAVDSPLANRCYSVIEEFGPAKIVAIAYKAFFALICIGLSIIFGIYGTRIIQMSNSLKVVPLNHEERDLIKKKKTEVKKNIAFTVIGTLCLLGQAANLLQSSIASDTNVYELFFVYVVELIPGIMFCFTFKVQSRQSDNLKSKKKYGTITRNFLYKAIPSEDNAPTSEIEMASISNNEVDIPFSQLKINQQIGEGNYGQVLSGFWNDIPVAIKVSKGNEAEIIHEVQIAKSISTHENVVQTFGLSRNGLQLLHVMELCNGMPLDRLLFDVPTVLEDHQKLKIIRSIAKGMAAIHQSNVIHKDLAARNILLSNDVPKISDFGLSETVDDIYAQHTTENLVGPIRWMAPEALKGLYNCKTDVWSFGILVYEIVCQSEPHVNEDSLFIGLKIRDQAYTPKIPTDCDPQFRQLMQRCWHADPTKRPDFVQICNTLEELSV